MASPTADQLRALEGNGTSKPLAVATRDSFITSSVAITRPADTTAYTLGDLVGGIAAIDNVSRSPGEALRVERVRLRKSGPSLTNASFRVRLFRLLPVTNVADNGVFNNNGALALADIHGYLGYFDIAMNESGTIGATGPAGTPNSGSGLTFETDPTAPTGQIWAMIEARGAYVPASGEVFTIVLEGARG